MTVRIVTDSSAGIPERLRTRWGISEVPLHILVAGVDLRDGVDDLPDDLLQRDDLTTAGAAPEELMRVYRAALADADAVVAVHISSELSGTFHAAKRAGSHLGDTVRVIDSRNAAMGVGFIALAAARAAVDTAGLDDVIAAAEAAVGRVHSFVAVQRLDNLRRSGRVGTASAWLGTALAVKPLLRMDDGKLVLTHRIRTFRRATSAMIDEVGEIVGDARAAIAVQHVDNPDGARAVADALGDRVTHNTPPIVAPLSPVLAVHIGSGAIAVSVDVGGIDR